MNRRTFLRSSGIAALVSSVDAGADPPAPAPGATAGKARFQFSVKSGMIADPGASTWEDKCRLLKDLGYDGVEMDSQYAVPAKECVAASEKTGIPVHGVVNGNHWSVRLSDPREETRREAVKQLRDAIRFCRDVGGSTVLLVPGAVRDPQNENAAQVWERSIAGLREVIPLAAELGVRIGIETVWNGFLYDPKGGSDQKPDEMLRYLDEINNTWVGAYLDLSNFLKYANLPQWVRALGPWLIKCDTKDFKLQENKFCDIGDGDVNWPETRRALAEVNYYGVDLE